MGDIVPLKAVEVCLCGSADLWDWHVEGVPAAYPRVMVRSEGSTSMWGGRTGSMGMSM